MLIATHIFKERQWQKYEDKLFHPLSQIITTNSYLKKQQRHQLATDSQHLEAIVSTKTRWKGRQWTEDLHQILIHITIRMAMFLPALIDKISKDPKCFNIHEVGHSRGNITIHLMLSSSKFLILKSCEFIHMVLQYLYALLPYFFYILIT